VQITSFFPCIRAWFRSFCNTKFKVSLIFPFPFVVFNLTLFSQRNQLGSWIRSGRWTKKPGAYFPLVGRFGLPETQPLAFGATPKKKTRGSEGVLRPLLFRHSPNFPQLCVPPPQPLAPCKKLTPPPWAGRSITNLSLGFLYKLKLTTNHQLQHPYRPLKPFLLFERHPRSWLVGTLRGPGKWWSGGFSA